MKLKFGMVGPSGAGKTLIANILGNEMSMDNSIGRPPYRPTNSVRIVEFSIPNIDIRKYTAEVDVQIWEIGGNPRLKSIWPGVQSNLDGIILVYDTNNELHVRDMSALHMHFVTHSNLNPAQCLIIGNQFRGNRETGQAKVVGVGPRVRHFVVNVDDDPNYLRDEFKHFLTGVAQFTLDQEKNPNNSFMASQEAMDGRGDAHPLMMEGSMKPPYRNYSQEDENVIQNQLTYQPYAEFHTARNNNRTNRTRSRIDSTGKNTEDEDDEDDESVETPVCTKPMRQMHNPSNGFRNIAKDEFSIHRKTRRN